MARHPNLKKNPNATVSFIEELDYLSSTVTQIIVNTGVSDIKLTELDLSRFHQLKVLEIGDHCFYYVKEVKLIGLKELKSVEIGKSSFTMKKRRGRIPDYGFHLRDCPKLKSLRIGHHSFPHYSVCEIENVDALEVIEIGDLNEYSNCFFYASLELRSAR